MEESLLKFKGTDWVGMVFGILSTLALAKEKRMGFIYGMVCGAGWLVFGVITGSVASVVSNVFLIGFNGHGWWRWKARHKGG
jgi:nicotinamide riboside transporter PnuC